MTFEDLWMTEQVYDLSSEIYLKYEVSPRQYFCNVAFNVLILIHTGYEMSKFSEKSHPAYDAAKKQEMRKNAEELADAILNELNKK